MHALAVGTRNDLHSLTFSSEKVMAEETPDVNGGLIFSYVEPDETVGPMTQCRSKEIFISRKERDSSKFVQKRDDGIVLYA